MLIYLALFLLLSPFVLYQVLKGYENPDPAITRCGDVFTAKFYPGGYSWCGFYSVEKCVEAAEKFKAGVGEGKLISFENNIRTITSNAVSLDGGSISETFGCVEVKFLR